MPWFKVDDGLCFHPKAIAAGNSAMGLWLRAGSWCGANLTGGWLPAAMIGTLGGQRRDASKLIHSGLWIHTGPTPDAHQPNTSGTPAAHEVGHEGDMSGCLACGMPEGYQFRSWEEYQPTKAQVEAERKAGKERQARWRERQANGSSNGVTNTVTNGATNGAPTRPDPTVVPSGTTSDGARKRGTRLPDDWSISQELRDWAVDEGIAPDFAIAENAKFVDYWRGVPGQKGSKLDWPGTWRNWIRRAAENNHPKPGRPVADPVGRLERTLQRVADRDNTQKELFQ